MCLVSSDRDDEQSFVYSVDDRLMEGGWERRIEGERERERVIKNADGRFSGGHLSSVQAQS
jgi:hypothetical protein